jgi:hypothetical protein
MSRTLVVAVSGVFVVATTAVAVAAAAQQRDVDCARTPVHHEGRSVGLPIDVLRQSIANEYATRAKFVIPRADGPDAIELQVSDVGGDFSLGDVRLIRDTSGDGWLRATTNTCGD